MLQLFKYVNMKIRIKHVAVLAYKFEHQQIQPLIFIISSKYYLKVI